MTAEEAMNTMQRVLRGLVISLAAAQRIDMPMFASLLQAFAANRNLDPTARAMLLDLAQGLDVLGTGLRPGPPPS